ncbi:MAG TPA: hypothetical protein VI122_21650 [Thermoleophilaceae bacterium]
MDSRRALTVLMAVAAAVAAAAMPSPASAKEPAKAPVVHELATFAAPDCVGGCGSGSTIGPDKTLYVTDGPGGRVLRVDPKTGAVTTFASGLPPAIPDVGIGGAIDVAFVGHTAYVLVTLVGPAFGQNDVVGGIYRIQRDGSATAIADIGAWSIAHPPATDFFVASGVQYALPTGLDVHGTTIYMGQAGPIPHLPQDGKVVKFTPTSAATEVASGASLIVDVEFGSYRQLYALSQGIWDLPPIPESEGAPASPDTGRLVRVRKDGSFTPVAEGLDRPTSLEFSRRTAFAITLTGKVIRIDNAGRPPIG